MKIGLFGGTFDPIHRGHTALAQAAREKFGLNRVLFVPANIPPHKQTQPLSAFGHRFAMVALATATDKSLIPSLLEAPAEESAEPAPIVPIKSAMKGAAGSKKSSAPPPPAANYTIDTIRRLKSSLKKIDELFFLIGIDAFRDIAKWHQAEQLFSEVEFIVASRPGYSLADVANSLPEKLRPAAHITKPFEKQPARGDLVLYTDADLPFDMDELQKACRVMRHYEADIVSAYRFDRTGEGWVRVVYSTIYNVLVRVLFGIRIRDINFAFKLCRRRVLDEITLVSEGSFIDAELVIRTIRSGGKVVQFGVDYFPRTRGVSTLSSPAVIVKILREMRAIRAELAALAPDRAGSVSVRPPAESG
jgi:cytidyltransferase-like protein